MYYSYKETQYVDYYLDKDNAVLYYRCKINSSLKNGFSLIRVKSVAVKGG